MTSSTATLLLCLALLVPSSGCSRQHNDDPASHPAPAPALKPAPPTPLAEQKEELGTNPWDPSWDLLIEKALPPDMLSLHAARAVHGFCPNFARESEADKRAFWAYFFQALAGAEAGLTKTVVVHHTQAAVNVVDKVTHAPVKQQGLLQLAYQDAGLYDCDFDWQRDRSLPEKDPRRTILQPGRNLGCGIRILHNQIITRDKPLVYRGSYWSTLQPGTRSFQVFRKQMANVPAACGVGPLKPKSSERPSRHVAGLHGRAQTATAAR